MLSRRLTKLTGTRPSLALRRSPICIAQTSTPITKGITLLSNNNDKRRPVRYNCVNRKVLSKTYPNRVFASPAPSGVFRYSVRVSNNRNMLLVVGGCANSVLGFRATARLLRSDNMGIAAIIVSSSITMGSDLCATKQHNITGAMLVRGLMNTTTRHNSSLSTYTRLKHGLGGRNRSVNVTLNTYAIPTTNGPSFALTSGRVRFNINVRNRPNVSHHPFSSLSRAISRVFSALLRGNSCRHALHF